MLINCKADNYCTVKENDYHVIYDTRYEQSRFKTFITAVFETILPDVNSYLPALAGVFRKIVTKAIGVGINVTTGTLGNILFSNAWCLTSMGGMVSLVADIVSDGKCDKRISF